ncbi:ATP-binding protein [Chitinispirillales bacterium ANBcel5]|uniref:sensor histidine kinase n=1 Tax=Cellulosispirillum alkaliphilum TaxID=3039283 RepID=UPI002A53EEEB|nr:ATP-binding protein [Chitinispirillales bacterium ANBcel5]
MVANPYLIPLIASVTIFIADFLSPLGYAHWLLYIIPILLSYKSENIKVVITTLVASVVLMFSGVVVSPTIGFPFFISFLNRVLGFIATTAFTIIILNLIKSKKEAMKYSQDLLEANSDLEAFSYSVSHDLRTPLQTIKGFGAILLEDYSEMFDSEGLLYLKKIVQGSEKMETIINDMLMLSRISRQEMKTGDINMADIAKTLICEFKSAQPNREVEFVIDENLSVRADPQLITIALTNLLSNAWKYTSKKSNGRIEFGKIDKEGKTIYYVRDNGAGFDMSRREKLFEPFSRLHSDSEFVGTGVGLTIVKRVIQRHRGEVWAEGVKGKGAVFYFTLHNPFII